ncbi:MAG: catalase, partial [Lachnospiraceae bacterium]|nr:catalase [Lachnospiraceae bacterium]
PVRMPKKYVIEMFCDRVAASKVYLGEQYDESAPLNYYLGGKTRRIIHEQTAKELEHLLVMLHEQGEEATFKHIRKALFMGKEL